MKTFKNIVRFIIALTILPVWLLGMIIIGFYEWLDEEDWEYYKKFFITESKIIQWLTIKR